MFLITKKFEKIKEENLFTYIILQCKTQLKMSNRSAFEEMKGICVEISRAEFEFYKQFTITLEGNIH